MQKKGLVRYFLKDTQAVSEEFTSLPALVLLMIGFSIFFILITNTYVAYQTRMETLSTYQMADIVAMKLTNPECFFIKPGGIFDLPLLRNSSGRLNQIRESYRPSGISFIVRITWEGNTGDPEDFPISLPENCGERIAVAKPIGVYLNEAQTCPGSLTVILWR